MGEGKTTLTLISFMPELKNRGLIIADTKPNDYILGGESKVVNIVLQPSRDYTDHLPVVEFQYGDKIETMACVTFSAWNTAETLAKAKYSEIWNMSDRFTAKMSGTGPSGNTLTNVGDSIRHDGSVDEIDWPFNRKNMTWSDYYSAIPVDKISLAKVFTEKYFVQYEWVLPQPPKLWEALLYGPVQVTVNTGSPIDGGIIQRHNTTNYNHAVMLFRGEEFKYFDIFDHYVKSIKRYAWNYDFGPSLKYSLEKKFMKLVKSNRAANKTVYLLDAKGYRRAFYDEQHFNSVAPILGLAKWKTENSNQTDWSQVQTIDESELVKFPLGRPMFIIE